MLQKSPRHTMRQRGAVFLLVLLLAVALAAAAGGGKDGKDSGKQPADNRSTSPKNAPPPQKVQGASGSSSSDGKVGAGKGLPLHRGSPPVARRWIRALRSRHSPLPPSPVSASRPQRHPSPPDRAPQSPAQPSCTFPRSCWRPVARRPAARCPIHLIPASFIFFLFISDPQNPPDGGKASRDEDNRQAMLKKWRQRFAVVAPHSPAQPMHPALRLTTS